MAQIIVGVDIGRDKIRAAKIGSSFKSISIEGFFEQPIEPADEEKSANDRLIEALVALKERGALKGEQIFVSLPPTEVGFHRIALPFSDKRRIEQTLPFELEEKLPYDFEEAIFDYTPVTESKETAVMLISATKREKVAELLSALAAAGIDPPLLTADIYAYPALLRTIEEAAAKSQGAPSQSGLERAPYAILDIGTELSAISVTENKKLRFGRVMRWGTAKLSESSGDKKALELLVNSIKLSLQADYKDGFAPVSQLYLTGEAASYQGFDEYLAKRLNVQVSTLPVFAAPSLENPEEILSPPNSSFQRALSLALLARFGKRGVANFRKDEFSFRGDFQLIRGGLIRAAVGLILVLFLAALNAYFSYSSLKDQEEALDKTLCETTTEVLGKCFDSYAQALSALKAPAGKSSGMGAIPKMTALDYLNEISKRKPETELFNVRDIDINMQKIRLEGQVDSYKSLEDTVNELKKIESFKEVNVGRSVKSLDGKTIEFDINIKLDS